MIARQTHRSGIRRVRLGLQLLDVRDVPAVAIDLTIRGSSGMANGAIFNQSDAHPTGSGVIDSFVRIQATGVEQGYNTDARPLQFDENKSPSFTHSLALGNVPVVTVNGVNYREFLLDINQKSSSPLLSLDELRLYVGSAPNLTRYDPVTHSLAGLAPVYDLDGAGGATVKMDYRLNPGSGGGDMTVYIPDSNFAGASANSYVYLYSKFGVAWGANSGFEEWAVRSGTSNETSPPPPSPGSATLSGTVVQDTNGDHVIDSGDLGFGGMEVDLLDANGNLVASTFTASDGTYSFSNITAGAYAVQMAVPANSSYAVMYPAVGSDGGSVNIYWTGISGVQLNSGDVATGYNMGVYLPGT